MTDAGLTDGQIDGLTLHEAAAELGVHYMTAYRYVRLGVLAATKSGGTWHVARADVAAFRSAVGEAAGSDAGSSAGSTARSRRGVRWDARLESRLLAGDASGAWGVIEAALGAGMAPEDVYIRVLTPALRSIGDRWETGEIDVAIEHRASGIAMRLIGRLGPRFARRGRRRGNVVIGAPAGERHSIAVAMLADLVRAEGWDVSDLGADVPAASFVHAAATVPDVVAVALSITTLAHLDAARSAFAAIRSVAPGVLLVAGGAALAAGGSGSRRRARGVDAAGLGADAVAADIESLTALLLDRDIVV